MKLITLYKFLTGLLILINIGVVSFFVLTKPNHPHHPHHHQNPIEILNLKGEQLTLFEISAHKHHTKMDSVMQIQKKTMGQYFKSLTDTALLEQKEQLSIELKELEAAKLNITYTHFEEIKKLLKPNQTVDFKSFTKSILNHMFLNENKPPHDRRNHRP